MDVGFLGEISKYITVIGVIATIIYTTYKTIKKIKFQATDICKFIKEQGQKFLELAERLGLYSKKEAKKFLKNNSEILLKWIANIEINFKRDLKTIEDSLSSLFMSFLSQNDGMKTASTVLAEIYELQEKTKEGIALIVKKYTLNLKLVE